MNVKNEVEKLSNRLGAEFAAGLVAIFNNAFAAPTEHAAGPARSRARTMSKPKNGFSEVNSKKVAPRLHRRAPDEIQEVIRRIVLVLGKVAPEGKRAEQIRDMLDLQAKELPRAFRLGIAEGHFHKTGSKRATLYFVGRAP